MQVKPFQRPDYQGSGYVCVAPGGCEQSPRISILSDGVWFREEPGKLWQSAHRGCLPPDN